MTTNSESCGMIQGVKLRQMPLPPSLPNSGAPLRVRGFHLSGNCTGCDAAGLYATNFYINSAYPVVRQAHHERVQG